MMRFKTLFLYITRHSTLNSILINLLTLESSIWNLVQIILHRNPMVRHPFSDALFLISDSRILGHVSSAKSLLRAEQNCQYENPCSRSLRKHKQAVKEKACLPFSCPVTLFRTWGVDVGAGNMLAADTHISQQPPRSSDGGGDASLHFWTLAWSHAEKPGRLTQGPCLPAFQTNKRRVNTIHFKRKLVATRFLDHVC